MTHQYSIREILNIKEGVYYSSSDFLSDCVYDYKQKIELRGELQKLLSSSDTLYICAICNQKIYLRSNPSKKGGENKGFHFAHYRDSKDCPYKTQRELKKREIDRLQYNGALESELHKSLKSELFKYIKLSNNVKDSKLEEVIKSNDLSLWRKPDLNFLYGDRRIALELQISTTWLSVIVERAEFYRKEGIYLFWVFDRFETDDNKRRLAYDDIVFNSMQNAFVFDEDTRTQSEQNNKLFLKCFYPIWSYNDITLGLDIEWKNEVVSFDDLRFDDEAKQIYYHDSLPSYTSAKMKQESARELKIEGDRIKVENRNAVQKNLTKTIKHLKELNQIIKNNKAEIEDISNKLSDQEQYKKDLLNVIEVKDNLFDDIYGSMYKYDTPYYEYNKTIVNDISKKAYNSYYPKVSEIKNTKKELNRSIESYTRRLKGLCNLKQVPISDCVYAIIPEEIASGKNMTFNDFNVFYIQKNSHLFKSNTIKRATNYIDESYIYLLDYNERCAELNKRLYQYNVELEKTEGKEIICKQDIKELLDAEINSRVELIDKTIAEYNTQLGELDMTLKRAENKKTTFERNNSCKKANCKNRQSRCPLERLDEYDKCSYYKASTSVNKL